MANLSRSRPKALNRSILNVEDGYNHNIIETLNSNYFIAVPQCRGFAQKFRGINRLATAFNIWRFVKTEIKYKKDPNEFQMIRLPGRILQDKVGDCKSMTLLCASLLANLAMPVVIRYASYSADRTPTHVYALTYDKDGSEIIIDAVWSKFNSQAPFKSKRDYLMKGQYK